MLIRQKIASILRCASDVAGAALDRRPRTAYVGGWTGKQNLGDEALLPAVAQLFPELTLVQYAGGRLARTAIRATPSLRAGIMGGGTLIGQKGFWLEVTREFLALRNHFLLFGTGVEEPDFWPGDPGLEEWKPVLDRCTFLGVRGPISADALRRLGYDRVQVVGDPVLAFARPEINPRPMAGSLGLNLGTADGRVFGGDESRVSAEMIKLAKFASKAGWQVEWFVVWPKDLQLTRQAAEASGTAAVIHEIYHDHEDFIDRTRKLSAFVGMKLHATLLATCGLTPSLMVEYRPKCRDYMQSINQDAATVRTDKFTADAAWELVRHWNEHHAESATLLAKGVHAMQREQRRLASLIQAHILEPGQPLPCPL